MSKTTDVSFVTKISTAKMGITQDDIRKVTGKGNGKPVPLFRVYGNVNNVKYGSTDKGEWTRFDGQIEAVNMNTGEVFRSGGLFLPPSVTPFLEGQLLQAKKDENFVSLQFAYDVQVKKSAVPIGYEYVPVNLLGTSEQDPLLAMREKFTALKSK